jgi:hypothetical protein
MCNLFCMIDATPISKILISALHVLAVLHEMLSCMLSCMNPFCFVLLENVFFFNLMFDKGDSFFLKIFT